MAQSRWRLNLDQVLVSNVPNGANGAMDLVMRTDQATDYIFAAVGTFTRAHLPQHRRGRLRNLAGRFLRSQPGPYLACHRAIKSKHHLRAGNMYRVRAGTNPNFPLSYTDGLLGVFKSTSSGDTGSWTTQTRNNSATLQDTLLLSNPVNGALTQCGIGTSQMLNQGWYDNVLVVDPTDQQSVDGGVDLFRSDNGGVNWGVASYWWFQGNGTPPNNVNGQFAHADNHVIAFHPNYNGTTNQTMFAGNDGGLFRSDNAATGNVGYSNGATVGGGTITPAARSAVLHSRLARLSVPSHCLGHGE